MGFSGIVQPIVGQDRAPTLPISNAIITVVNENGSVVAAWDNSYCFRLQISNIDLRVDLDIPGEHPVMTYVRALQGRETLREVRQWTIKCWAPAHKLSDSQRQWLQNLRFIGNDGAVIKVQEEILEQAALHVPRVHLAHFEDGDKRLGVWGGVLEKMAINKLIIEAENEAKASHDVGFATQPAKPAPSFLGGGPIDTEALAQQYSKLPTRRLALFGDPATTSAPVKQSTSVVPPLIVSQIKAVNPPLAGVEPQPPVKPATPMKGRYPSRRKARLWSSSSEFSPVDSPSTDRPMTTFTRATRAALWYGPKQEDNPQEMLGSQTERIYRATTSTTRGGSLTSRQRTHSSGEVLPSQPSDGAFDASDRGTHQRAEHKAASFDGTIASARTENVSNPSLATRDAAGSSRDRARVQFSARSSEDNHVDEHTSAFPKGLYKLSTRQVALLQERATMKQEVLAERTLEQLPTSPGMPAAQRFQRMRTAISTPGLYTCLDVHSTGEVRWSSELQRTLRAKAGFASEKPPWRAVSGTKKCSDTLSRAPVLASWGWRGEQQMPGLQKVSLKSNDIGLTGSNTTRMPSQFGVPVVD